MTEKEIMIIVICILTSLVIGLIAGLIDILK